MPMDTIRKSVVPSDVYRTPVLDDISIAAFSDNASDYIARQWFPTIAEPEQQFKYYVIDMASIQQNKAAPRAPGNKAEEGSWNQSLVTQVCGEYGYREKLPEELIATTQGAAAAEETSALSVAEVLNISEEFRIANIAWKTGVWNRDVTGVASGPTGPQVIFWNLATGTPITDALNERPKIKLASRRWPNTLILGADVVAPLLTNPQVIARVVNGQRPGMSAQATLDDIANLFKVDRVLVAGAVYNSSNETTTNAGVAQIDTPSFILNSKCAWLGYVNPNPSKRQTSAGYRFTWQGISGNADGYRTWKYWAQDIRSFWVEGAVDDAFVVVSSKAGTFFSAVVQ